MYSEYWNLNRVPFVNQNDTDFYYPSSSHHAALLKLQYVRDHAYGAAVVVGGSGSGKSFLIGQMAAETAQDGKPAPIVHLLYSRMTAPEILCYIAMELGASGDSASSTDGSLDRVLRALEQRLVHLTETERHPIIVIDEAHLIEDPAVWSALTLLLNYQQKPECRFTIVLLGNRTLIGQISRQAQLETRVTVKSMLQPLTLEETAGYVEHRLQIAGSTAEIFSPSALHTIFELSNGVPARINRLCDLALLVGYADKLTTISESEIEAVADELAFLMPD